MSCRNYRARIKISEAERGSPVLGPRFVCGLEKRPRTPKPGVRATPYYPCLGEGMGGGPEEIGLLLLRHRGGRATRK
jgi:hypothetical protein